MERAFLDLLTFPRRRGGRDTPSRLALIAGELNYSTVGVYGSLEVEKSRGLDQLENISVISITEIGKGGESELTFASGKRARRAASTGNIDFIIPDRRDEVALRFAVENEVTIAYPYSEILSTRGIKRSSIIQDWCTMHQALTRREGTEIMVSGARNSYLLRDPRDIASLIHTIFDVDLKEALSWISTRPDHILKRAREVE